LPIKAALLYLTAKMRRDIYVTDMLFYTARGFVAKPESLPRYYDLVRPARRAVAKEYNVGDVIDMFRGRGKLR